MNVNRLPDPGRTPTRRRAGRPVALVIAAAMLVASSLVLQGPATAAPPRCPDGSYPPCDGDDPPDPPEPPAPPTTDDPPPPPPTTSPPPPSTWVANAVLLNQSPTPFGTLVADRWFIPRLPHGKPTDPPTPSDPIHGGSATMQGGRFTFAPVTRPDRTLVQIHVSDGAGRGPLCRTAPRASMPNSGGVIRIIAAPPQVTGPHELDAMVSGITGELDKKTNADGTVQTVTAASATLVPQADGLMLTLVGTLDLDFPDPAVDWRIGFTFRQRLTLRGSQGFNVAEALDVELAGPATADLTWVSGEPSTGGGDILTLVAAQLIPQMRTGVLAKAGPLINPKVAQLHAVRWWTEQGFTLSIRNVGYSTAGLSVEASFCRLG